MSASATPHWEDVMTVQRGGKNCVMASHVLVDCIYLNVADVAEGDRTEAMCLPLTPDEALDLAARLIAAVRDPDRARR